MNDHTTQPTVLIVDDAADTLAMLSDALGFEGMTPIAASGGEKALSLVAELRPDMVLMDAMMPGMDGFEACRILKSEMGFSDLPVIFMTGRNDSEHVVRALAAGGVDFVAKPLVLTELLARMRVHLANARKSRSARDALDSTGRRIVAVARNGAVLWSTPQAQELLTRAGIRSDEGAPFPWEIRTWIGEQGGVPTADQGGFLHERFGKLIEFRLMANPQDGETLLRLIDRNAGSQEERLARAFGLSLREAEVLMWITHGKANKEIAEILDLSPRTVNKHLETIFEKLGIENRTAAATMSVRILWE
ncbi:MAG: DNA-binding response regulator [Candidatus Devosia phytovorans]|uniref:DNA-binding response regulator n=1 Tax=Candidatus Devosia phytovorans TaxID=3121372 RepID=A0AAJ5VY51_9HYPH|nr:DNA-binding response regulator [Devosia sp.]WEK06045.1 MAG: DNA-binding response regulator [Devosia sp.]